MHLFKPRKTDTDAVLSQYGDMLYRLALTRLGNEADAQDIVQDVFLKYLSLKPTFNDQSHEKAWFLRTTINCCHDFLRKQKLRNHLSLEDATHIAEGGDDGVGHLLELIAQLPPIYKDVVILHSLEGFSTAETADVLEISVSAVKMRLSRAREILQILRKEENDVY